MKKRFFIFAAFVMAIMSVCSLASCGDDDDEAEAANPEIAKMIIGTWKTHVHDDYYSDGTISSYYRYFRFNADGTMAYDERDSYSSKALDDTNGTYTISGNKLTIVSKKYNKTVTIGEYSNVEAKVYGDITIGDHTSPITFTRVE